MIKWFAYIVIVLILIPCLSFARLEAAPRHGAFEGRIVNPLLIDTVPKTAKQLKQQEIDEKKKIKEITKAKRLPKPEKVDESTGADVKPKAKPKRQRRPAGMDRPPEIPRRNGN